MMRRRLCLVAGVIGCIVGLLAAPVRAQAPTPPAAVPEMPTQDVQGLSCLAGGLLAAVAVAAYRDFIVSPNVSRSLLPLGLMAGAFVAGCVVGTNSAPGLRWLYRQVQ
jgi:hypothetical protein